MSPPTILVFPSKFVRGADTPSLLTSRGEPAPTFAPVPFEEAFLSPWPTDAHAVAYGGAGPMPRVNKGAGLPLRFRWIFLDADTPGHVPADPAWWLAQVAALPPALRATCGWYATKNGIRFVWWLPRELDAPAYKATQEQLAQFLVEAGVPIDLKALGPYRLYRLPRVVRDGEPQDLPSDFTNLGPLQLTRAILEAATPRQGPIVKGERDAALTSEAGRLRAAGADEPTILAHLISVNKDRVTPPLPQTDLERIARSVARYEPARPTADVEPLTVPVRAGQLHNLVTVASDLLATAPDIYSRAGELVHVATGHEEPRIVPFTVSTLRARLGALANWVRPGKDGMKPCDVPRDVATAVLEARDWPSVRPLARVSTVPVLRPSGTLATQEGYDADSKTLIVDPPPVEHPQASKEAALEALQKLVDLIVDFPFQEPFHRSAALAAIITATARNAIDGPTPLFLVDASTRASGKGKLVDLISTLATGRAAPKLAQTDGTETEKRITAALLAGAQILTFDNLTKPLGGAVLDAAVTADYWQGRRLGESSMVTLPNRVTWFATGNNVQVRGDMARRVVHVYLDPKTERPELRDGWRHPYLLRYAREHRAELVTAALAVPFAYLASGQRPQLHAFGSFEEWSRVVREALVWLGEPDPLRGQTEIRDDGDEQTIAMTALVDRLATVYGVGQPFHATDLAQRSLTDPTIRESLEVLVGDPRKFTARYIGWVLTRYRNRYLSGLFVARGAKSKGGRTWVVGKVVDDGDGTK